MSRQIKLLKRHVFNFNPEDNGGEALILTTKYYDNGDNDENSVFTNQELSLHSYGNSAQINLYSSSFDPETLRKLANELDEAKKQAKLSRDAKTT